jgi:carbamoyltransferase
MLALKENKKIKNLNLILGISDSVDCGATLTKNNKILCSVNEERFNRKKFCYGFPKESIFSVLKFGKVKSKDIKVVAVAGISRITKSFTPYNNLLHDNKRKTIDFVWKIASLMSFLSNNFVFKFFFRSGFFLFFLSNVYYKPFLFLRKKNILDNLKKIGINPEQIFFYDHHECHIFSAYSISPYKKALVVSNDGFGDGLCSKSNYISLKENTNLSKNTFYNSLGLIYGYCSDLCGYKKIYHNGKTTGIAMLGDGKNAEKELNKLLFFNDKNGNYVNNGALFRGTYLEIKRKLKKFSKYQIASGIQSLTNKLIFKQVEFLLKKIKTNNICLTGGVHANVAANGFLRNKLKNKNIYVAPHMGDGGLALGACALAYFQLNAENVKYKNKNIYLGDEFSNKEILKEIYKSKVKFKKISNLSMSKIIARSLANNKIVAIYNGRMEFGPRALGNRSILANASDESINQKLNKKLNRTETMPFAPVILESFAHKMIKNYKTSDLASCQNMTMCVDASEYMKKISSGAVAKDGTIRPQLIKKKTNKLLYNILSEYYKITKVPSVINTSFNLHDEPIVRTPSEAIKSFKISKLDALVLGDYILEK